MDCSEAKAEIIHLEYRGISLLFIIGLVTGLGILGLLIYLIYKRAKGEEIANFLKPPEERE